MRLKDFGAKLYAKLPHIYKSEDAILDNVSGPLERYITSLSEGGIDLLIETIEMVFYFRDPATCPDDKLEALCGTVGLPYRSDIPASYLRRLLMQYPSLLKRKGTQWCLMRVGSILAEEPVFITVYHNTQQVVIGVPEGINSAVTTAAITAYAQFFVPLMYSLSVADLYMDTEEASIDTFVESFTDAVSTYATEELNASDGISKFDITEITGWTETEEAQMAELATSIVTYESLTNVIRGLPFATNGYSRTTLPY